MSDLEDGELSEEGEIADDQLPVSSLSPQLLAPPPPLPNLSMLTTPVLARHQPPSMPDYADVDYRRNDKFARSDLFGAPPPRHPTQQDILQMHNRPPPPMPNKTDVDMRKRAHPSPPQAMMDDAKRVRAFAHPPPPSFGMINGGQGGPPRMPQPPPPGAQCQAPRRRYLCKFFREGHCRDSTKCTFSHSAGDANRAPELCKWYADSFCRKGAHCQYLHAEWPCLQFAKGTCERSPCKYSHEALDAFSRPIVERFLADEKMATERAAKAAAVKPLPPRHPRRVLLRLPLSQRGEMQVCEFAKALQYQRLVFVEDALATRQAQQLALQHQQQAAAAAAMSVTQQLTTTTRQAPPDACFTPIAPRLGGLLATPTVPPVNTGASIEIYAQQAPAGHVEMSAYRQPIVESNYSGNVAPSYGAAQHSSPRNVERERSPKLPADVRADRDEQQEDKPPTFNLQEMLARIKAQVPPSKQKAKQEEARKVVEEEMPVVDESPASPPPPMVVNGGAAARSTSKPLIPAAKSIKWRLRAVYVRHAPNTNIAQHLLDAALTDLRLRSDPRIKKALSEQFNATTSALATALPHQQATTTAPEPHRVGARDPRLARRQAQQLNESTEQSASAAAAPSPNGGGWMPSFSSSTATARKPSPPAASKAPTLFAPVDPRLARKAKTTAAEARWKPALGVRDS